MSVILQAPFPSLTTATILPNPQLANVESHRQTVEFHRSLNNTKRTYVKSSSRKLLTFAFRLTKGKALELEAFIKLFYASRIKMIDHEGKTWIVNFESNPFEFSESERAGGVPGNAMNTITLNFEGVQI
jgi:hypothetical protein